MLACTADGRGLATLTLARMAPGSPKIFFSLLTVVTICDLIYPLQDVKSALAKSPLVYVGDGGSCLYVVFCCREAVEKHWGINLIGHRELIEYMEFGSEAQGQ